MKDLNFDKVKELMDEFDIEFKTAKKALKKARGNYQGAVIYIDHWKNKKRKINNEKLDIFLDNLLGIMKYKFEAKKDNKVLLSLNVLVILLISILISIFSYRSDVTIIVIILILFAMYHKIEITLTPYHVSDEEINTVNRDVVETLEEDDTETEYDDEDYNEIEV